MMKFSKLVCVLTGLCLVSAWSVYAEDTYEFKDSGECALKKSESGKWNSASAEEVRGSTVAIQPLKSNIEYSVFRLNNSWYTAKSYCFRKVSSSTSSEKNSEKNTEKKAQKTASSRKNQETEESSHRDDAFSSGDLLRAGHFWAELRGGLPMMTGKGTDASTSTEGSLTFAVNEYKADLNFGLRAGYNLNNNHALFLEYATFSGKVLGTITSGSTQYGFSQNDSISKINTGYEYYFGDLGFVPFAGIAVGLVKYSSALNASGLFDLKVSTTVIDIAPEIGVLYEVFSDFFVMGRLDYTLLSVTEATVDSSSNTTLFPVGTKLTNEMSYTHLGLHLGIRYQF